MPEPAAHAFETPLPEMLTPTRSRCGQIVCDCCRKRKNASDFDEDGFGICTDCLGADVLLVELDAGVRTDRSTPP
ncbi:hypothetical protein HFO63_00455 [Rhizobium laguerreae]|uniref:hypothetical protein n=1 Tax=Rhizobium laguerreae TaxID=1076926 RepID=UPI001C9078E3|nr:hypothetical protein [Rhizobium laguerreae]MBY3144080.1 hypothetical protein [Rhizobium laguerreae]